MGEAAPGRLASYESHAGGIRDCYERLEPHDESKVTVDTNELNLSDVGRARHKRIQKCSLVSNDLVVRPVYHKLIRP